MDATQVLELPVQNKVQKAKVKQNWPRYVPNLRELGFKVGPSLVFG